MKENSPVYLPYPASLRQSVEEAVVAWKAFCALPENERGKFPYNKGAGMGVGYEIKKTEGAALDLKENFHFTLGEEAWLENEAKNLNKESKNLVSVASKLMAGIKPLIITFAEKMEKEYSLVGLAEETKGSEPNYFLRFLHYFGDREIGDEIATPHADKSGFTLHLYESDPGLQYLDFSKKWQEMPVSEEETVIIPGMQLQYKSEGKMKAICHRVIATEATAKVGRFSMVCFIALGKTAKYNKGGAGRLQEFEPGFNYQMPFQEFSQLFK